MPTWTPVAEIYETPQEYVVSLGIAGLTEDEISVHQINNILIVRGTRNFRRASEADYCSILRDTDDPCGSIYVLILPVSLGNNAVFPVAGVVTSLARGRIAESD